MKGMEITGPKESCTLNGDVSYTPDSAFNSFCTVDTEITVSREQICKDELTDAHFCILQQDVQRAFVGCKDHRSPGSDKLTGHMLECCSHQLAAIFTLIFQKSLDLDLATTPRENIKQLFLCQKFIHVPK